MEICGIDWNSIKMYQTLSNAKVLGQKFQFSAQLLLELGAVGKNLLTHLLLLLIVEGPLKPQSINVNQNCWDLLGSAGE